MDNINLLVIPSVSAIAIKLLILWLGRKSLANVDFWAWTFFMVLFGMNLTELIGFVFQEVLSNDARLLFLIAYYGFTIVAGLSFLAIAMKISGDLSRPVAHLIFATMVVGLTVLLLPNVGLLGIQSIGYSYTRIPGPYYWVLQIIILGGWLLGLCMLIHTLRRGKDWIPRRRAFAMLIATTPTGLGLVLVIILMQIGFKINATLMFSISTNFLLGVLIYTEYEFRLFHFLSSVPKTEENKLVCSIINNLASSRTYNLSRLSSEFEKLLIENALGSHKYNKTKTAKSLGISRNTLRRKLVISN